MASSAADIYQQPKNTESELLLLLFLPAILFLFCLLLQLLLGLLMMNFRI